MDLKTEYDHFDNYAEFIHKNTIETAIKNCIQINI